MSARGNAPRPPRFTSAILRTLLGRASEFVLGDLEEDYRDVHAARGQVVREVVFAGAARAAIGIPFGLLLTLGLARAMQSLLFEVPSADPVTFTVVSALVLSVTIASLLLPAHAAASTDPAVATRSE